MEGTADLLGTWHDSAADLTSGLCIERGKLDIREVREALEAILIEYPGNQFPCVDFKCHCGVMHEVPGKWFLVCDNLTREPLVTPQVFFRCPHCTNISFPDPLDQMAGVMEFYQVKKNPIGGAPLLECVEYDLGGLEGAIKPWLENPEQK